MESINYLHQNQATEWEQVMALLRQHLQTGNRQQISELQRMCQQTLHETDHNNSISTIRSGAPEEDVDMAHGQLDLDNTIHIIQQETIEQETPLSTSYLNALRLKHTYSSARLQWTKKQKGNNYSQGPKNAYKPSYQLSASKTQGITSSVMLQPSTSSAGRQDNQKLGQLGTRTRATVTYYTQEGVTRQGGTSPLAKQPSLSSDTGMLTYSDRAKTAPQQLATNPEAKGRQGTAGTDHSLQPAMMAQRISRIQPSINIIMDKLARLTVDEGDLSYIQPLDTSAAQDLESDHQETSMVIDTSDVKGHMPQEKRQSYTKIQTQWGEGKLPVLPIITLDIDNFSRYVMDPDLITQLREGIHYDMSAYEAIKGDVHFMQANYTNQNATEIEATTKVIQAYLTAGYVETCDHAALHATSPIFIKQNQSGTLRLCLDAQRINELFMPPSIEMESVYAPLKGMKQWSTKIDFRAAYNHFKLQPEFRNWFGFTWNGTSYRFTTLPAGWRMSSYVCQKLLEGPHLHLQRLHPDMCCTIYIDDSLYQHDDYNQLKQITEDNISFWQSLGVQINFDKSIREPTRSIEWLGLLYSNLGLELTDNLKQNIRRTYAIYHKYKSLHQLQRLIGLLIFASKVAKAAAPLLVQLARTINRPPTVGYEREQTYWDPYSGGCTTTKSRAQLKPELNQKSTFTLDRYHAQMLKTAYDYVLDNPTLQPKLHPETYIFEIASINNQIGLSTIGRAKTDRQGVAAMSHYPELNPHAFRAYEEGRNTLPYIKEQLSICISKEEQYQDNTYKEAVAVKLLISNCPAKSNLVLCISSPETYWSFKKGICRQTRTAQLISSAYHAARTRNITFVLRFIPWSTNQAVQPARRFIREKRHEYYDTQTRSYHINWQALYLRKGINNTIRKGELHDWINYRYLEPQSDLMHTQSERLEQDRQMEIKYQQAHSLSINSSPDSSPSASPGAKGALKQGKQDVSEDSPSIMRTHSSQSASSSAGPGQYDFNDKLPPPKTIFHPVQAPENYRYRSEREQLDCDLVQEHKQKEYTYFRIFVAKMHAVPNLDFRKVTIHVSLTQSVWSSLVLMEYAELILEDEFFWLEREELIIPFIPSSHPLWTLHVTKPLDQDEMNSILFRSVLTTINLFRKVPRKIQPILEKLRKQAKLNEFLIVKCQRGLMTAGEILGIESEWLFDQQYNRYLDAQSKPTIKPITTHQQLWQRKTGTQVVSFGLAQRQLASSVQVSSHNTQSQATRIASEQAYQTPSNQHQKWVPQNQADREALFNTQHEELKDSYNRTSKPAVESKGYIGPKGLNPNFGATYNDALAQMRREGLYDPASITDSYNRQYIDLIHQDKEYPNEKGDIRTNTIIQQLKRTHSEAHDQLEHQQEEDAIAAHKHQNYPSSGTSQTRRYPGPTQIGQTRATIQVQRKTTEGRALQDLNKSIHAQSDGTTSEANISHHYHNQSFSSLGSPMQMGYVQQDELRQSQHSNHTNQQDPGGSLGLLTNDQHLDSLSRSGSKRIKTGQLDKQMADYQLLYQQAISQFKQTALNLEKSIQLGADLLPDNQTTTNQMLDSSMRGTGGAYERQPDYHHHLLPEGQLRSNEGVMGPPTGRGHTSSQGTLTSVQARSATSYQSASQGSPTTVQLVPGLGMQEAQQHHDSVQSKGSLSSPDQHYYHQQQPANEDSDKATQ